ncbi:Microtubule-actin cross-linking factor 1 [Geodia barretti]|uniref:Microtubule-actin cross-linking factor 1 n=1 Tax=Geodia barretti TaxID=519541 RepID=A0AA35R396_GEOBA|nr:Microtubule-actin cross-linking factor 1 [Geodia barretti]
MRPTKASLTQTVPFQRWQRLCLKSSERHRQLLEVRTRLNDIVLARSFSFDVWRKNFNGWVDQQKLRVNDLFRRFDSNHDGMLTRDDVIRGFKASGLAMSQIELEKIADHFDRTKTATLTAVRSAPTQGSAESTVSV